MHIEPLLVHIIFEDKKYCEQKPAQPDLFFSN